MENSNNLRTTYPANNTFSNFLDTDSLPKFNLSNIKLSDKLYVLNLPTRLINILYRDYIRTVDDFIKCPDEDLIDLRNIGPKSVNYLLKVKALLNGINERSLQIEPEEQVLDRRELELRNSTGINCAVTATNQLLDEFLSILSDRERTILMERFGLLDGEHKTLEEIGTKYGITRERIRQIQNKGLVRLRRGLERNVALQMVNIIKHIIETHSYVISGEEADQLLNETFQNAIYDGSSILDLLSELGLISKAEIGDVMAYSVPEYSNVTQISEMILNLIRKNNKLLNIDNLTYILLKYKLIKIQDTDKKEFIKKYINLDPRISLLENEYVTTNSPHKKTLWVDKIKQVLEEAGVPLHYTEIADKVNSSFADLDLYIDQRRVHSLLISEKEFAHTGRWGAYGLSSWGLRKEGTPMLIKECLEKAGFPMHLDQIFAYVGKYKDTSRNNIKSVLELNRNFVRVAHNVYGLKSV